MGSLVFLSHNRKLVENIGYGVAGLREVVLERGQLLRRLALSLAPGTIRLAWQIEVEESCVQFAADLEAPFVVPRERWTVIVTVTCQRCQVVGRIHQLKGSWCKPRSLITGSRVDWMSALTSSGGV